MTTAPGFFDRAEMLIPPMFWDRPRLRETSGDLVVLLHGLWRGWHAMDPLARRLSAAGFSTLNIPYPSSTKSPEVIVSRVRREIEKVAGNKTVHLVTHSLGGIVARLMLSGNPEWNSGRLVMLAAPNRGSQIVDWAANHPILHWVLGPSGRVLGTNGVPAGIPPLPENLESAVIMGRKSSIPLFRKLLDPDNDGIVSAERGRIEGIKGFTVIDADHTFIQAHPATVELTVEFLKSGRWKA